MFQRMPNTKLDLLWNVIRYHCHFQSKYIIMIYFKCHNWLVLRLVNIFVCFSFLLSWYVEGNINVIDSYRLILVDIFCVSMIMTSFHEIPSFCLVGNQMLYQDLVNVALSKLLCFRSTETNSICFTLYALITTKFTIIVDCKSTYQSCETGLERESEAGGI